MATTSMQPRVIRCWGTSELTLVGMKSDESSRDVINCFGVISECRDFGN